MWRGKGPWLARVLMLTGVIIVTVAVAAVAYPLWWNHRSEATGNSLLREHLLVRHQTSGAPRCTPSPPSRYGSHLDRPLAIPSLGRRAPVLQGPSAPALHAAPRHPS